MTFEDRVRALEPLGLTPRQTRFLVTVALHSGYCVRRQYVAFAGVRYGKNVRAFLDGLVSRGVALRSTFRAGRGHVYHVHDKSIYRALGQEDNRNRRVASAALIARKLMALDFVLSEPEVDWVATEAEKVALFTTRFGVDLADLPSRTFDASLAGEGHTTRYFIHKLPIYLVGNPPVPHFVYVGVDRTAQTFEQFLRDHARLLAHVKEWVVVCVQPPHLQSLDAFAQTFKRFVGGEGAGASADELKRYFAARRLVESEQLSRLSVADLYEYRGARRRYSGAAIDRLYEAWVVQGDQVIAGTMTPLAGSGRLLIRTLPHAYEQFGTMAGVA